MQFNQILLKFLINSIIRNNQIFPLLYPALISQIVTTNVIPMSNIPPCEPQIILNQGSMNSQLKDKNKEVQGRKFKPIKVPTKAQMSSAIQSSRHEEAEVAKVTENKENKLKSKVAVGSEQKKVKTRESVCTELLREGFIQSFIDLFYISHKCLPNVMNNKNYFGEVITSQDEQELSESDHAMLNDLATTLKKAQSFSYYNDTEKQNAMNEYNSLAYVYEDQGDYLVSAYFYNKVIDLARSAKNKQYEVIAMVGMGKCYDQEHRTDKAIRVLEESLGKAREIDNQGERANLVRTISKDLIEIYMKEAEQHEREDPTEEEALMYLEKCLEVAKNSHESDTEGRICFKIGELYYRSEQYKKSVTYQEKYLDLIKLQMEETKKINDEGKDKTESSMKTKSMEAHASLAKCYLKMKQIELAENHLNHYNQLAKELKIQNAQADSSYYLAKLYEQKGNNTKAIEFYKAYFEAAKSERPEKKNRALVDKARVTYAIAKANENMDRFISMFQGENSLKDILDWKIKKELK